MSVPADPLLETLVNDFGANYAFALDLLQEYRQDRRGVDPTWREYFDRVTGTPSADEEPPRRAAGAGEGGGTQPLAAITEQGAGAEGQGQAGALSESDR